MQHTKNYNFNLIESTDAFGPEELNANAEATERELLAARSEFAAGDAALSAAHAADKKALEAADAELQAAVQKAQTTADRAEGKADTLPYAVGSYKGDGGTQTIEVGFRPSVLIIAGDDETTSGSREPDLVHYCVTVTPGRKFTLVTLTDTGFTVKDNGGANKYPTLNHDKQAYGYIAFR